MNRWVLAFQAIGIIVEWGKEALSTVSEEGSKVSKAEAVDLARRILKMLDVNLDEIV
jgi:hypothetical protein